MLLGREKGVQRFPAAVAMGGEKFVETQRKAAVGAAHRDSACQQAGQRADAARLEQRGHRLGAGIDQRKQGRSHAHSGSGIKNKAKTIGILHREAPFSGRSRRPPLDPINALLSFAYSLLARDCAAALEGVGLDPYVGFLHRPRPGRASLALDLMEELRCVYADRFVLSCVNQRILTGEHCHRQESGAVFLTDEGRRAFLSAWQKRRQEAITHPFLGEKLPWGLVPYVQALLLARTLRGDLERYPPFFWK